MTDDLIGRQLDEYRVEALLGQGGMARVYRAIDVKLERHVALKVVDTPFRTDSDYIMRFQREAQAVARLEHSHIVRLYRYGEVDGLLYMAMQFVEGADLRFILDTYNRDSQIIEPDQAVRIMWEAASALDYAHSKGVIHRDVKPANILLNRQGDVLLGDFGLALLTEIGTKGEIFGSPHYVAPEQAISSAGACPTSDLYALGIILFEMFTGQVPFDAPDPLDIAMMHMSEPPPSPSMLRPEISPALERVILKAIAKEPEDRYASGADLVGDLEEALHQAETASTHTLAHATIVQRVTSEPDAVPTLPAAGLPAAAVSDNELLIPDEAFAPRPRRVSPLLIGGLVLSIAVLLALLIGGALLLRSAGQASSQPLIAAAMSETPTSLEVSWPTPAPSPTLQAQPIEEAGSTVDAAAQALPSPSPSLTPIPFTPTPEPVTYTLWLGKRGDESLFVMNQSPAGLPLASLQIGDGKGSVKGTEWGLEFLGQGECVTVWGKKDNDAKAPEGIDCTQVGKALDRRGKERFWEEAFPVYYAGREVGVCSKGEDICVISFSTESNGS
ncbi:MAG: protein kinase [Anaerolineae bacterium]|nr:protein kinase [Anaerolineae bacterium]